MVEGTLKLNECPAGHVMERRPIALAPEALDRVLAEAAISFPDAILIDLRVEMHVTQAHPLITTKKQDRGKGKPGEPGSRPPTMPHM